MTAALRSLWYRPNQPVPDESKNGFVYYNGSANDFHYWDFKTELKFAALKAEDIPREVHQLDETQLDQRKVTGLDFSRTKSRLFKNSPAHGRHVVLASP